VISAAISGNILFGKEIGGWKIRDSHSSNLFDAELCLCCQCNWGVPFVVDNLFYVQIKWGNDRSIETGTFSEYKKSHFSWFSVPPLPEVTNFEARCSFTKTSFVIIDENGADRRA
jgi:hypothetical protein